MLAPVWLFLMKQGEFLIDRQCGELKTGYVPQASNQTGEVYVRICRTSDVYNCNAVLGMCLLSNG